MSEAPKRKTTLGKAAKKKAAAKPLDVRDVVSIPAFGPSTKKKLVVNSDLFRDVMRVRPAVQLDKSLAKGTVSKLQAFKKGVKF